MHEFDVIISGCGPVGATLAVLLGKHGLHTLVLERYEEVYDKPRAIVLDWEVMRVFQFCDVAHDLASNIAPHPGTNFLGVDEQLIKLFDPAPPPYPLGWPATIVFIQPELEHLLRKKITELDNVEVKFGTTFDGLSQDSNGVVIRYTDLATGTQHKASCNYLVGCDGANSTVREELGIELTDFGFDEWWVVVDAWLMRDANLPEKTTQYCWPSRPATYVVGPQNLRRWEIKIMPGETPEEFHQGTKLQDVLSAYVDVDALDIWRSAPYRFNARVGGKWRDNRVFLAGDAMHQTPPFLGQGLCAGIRDVANLSWKLIRSNTHGASNALFDSYESERLPHVSQIIEHAKDFGLIIGELDETLARARDKRLSAELHSGKMETSRQGFIPNLETGLLAEDDPLAGTLMVQPKIVQTDKEVLLDDIAPMEFLYLASDIDAQSWADPLADQMEIMGIKRLTIGQGGLIEAGNTFADWIETHGIKAALIRPDRYVYGGVRNKGELNSVLSSLAKQLGN